MAQNRTYRFAVDGSGHYPQISVIETSEREAREAVAYMYNTEYGFCTPIDPEDLILVCVTRHGVTQLPMYWSEMLQMMVTIPEN